MAALPEGQRGRLLALAVLAGALGVLWVAVAAPALGWFESREALLLRDRTLAARMASVADALPALERAAAARPARPAGAALLPGGSDALAAAALQERLGTLAREHDATLVSSDPLPAQPAGQVRRVSLRVVLSATYPSLLALLQAMAQDTPTILVDELTLRAPLAVGSGQAPPMEVGLTASAFRAEAPAGPPS